MNNKKRKKLKACVIPMANVSDTLKERMYRIFEKYYAQTSYETFYRDLQKKDAVIILKDREDHKLRGFSTLLNIKIVAGGQVVYGAFSGDTVVEKEYWGQSALQVAFLKYLWREKWKRPLTPYYWFLISKGYKTYLLMANNFSEYYPHPQWKCPPKKREIITAFAMYLYPDSYDAQSGLIIFSEGNSHLRSEVAPIDEKLTQKNSKVSFFINNNPTWQQGTELACIARMTWAMPIKYILRYWINSLKRKFAKFS